MTYLMIDFVPEDCLAFCIRGLDDVARSKPTHQPVPTAAEGVVIVALLSKVGWLGLHEILHLVDELAIGKVACGVGIASGAHVDKGGAQPDMWQF